MRPAATCTSPPYARPTSLSPAQPPCSSPPAFRAAKRRGHGGPEPLPSCSCACAAADRAPVAPRGEGASAGAGAKGEGRMGEIGGGGGGEGDVWRRHAKAGRIWWGGRREAGGGRPEAGGRRREAEAEAWPGGWGWGGIRGASSHAPAMSTASRCLAPPPPPWSRQASTARCPLRSGCRPPTPCPSSPSGAVEGSLSTGSQVQGGHPGIESLSSQVFSATLNRSAAEGVNLITNDPPRPEFHFAANDTRPTKRP